MIIGMKSSSSKFLAGIGGRWVLSAAAVVGGAVGLVGPAQAQLGVANVGTIAVGADLSRKLTADHQVRVAAHVLASRVTVDGDGYPLPLAHGSGVGPVGGGLVPAGVGAPETDGYGVRLGYCAWDNGSSTGAAGRIAGTNSIGAVTLAVVSPGVDKVFNTSCAQIAAGVAAQGDDYYMAFTASQMLAGVGAPASMEVAQSAANLAALNALPAAALKDGQIRLARDTNQLYRYNASTAGWVSVTANSSGGTATAVAGGSSGSLLVQTGADTTGFVAPNGSATKMFLSQQSGATPVWSTLTKSDLGLGNVENTALSTWAGSTNITSVGTITSGTWRGTPVEVAYGGTGATTAAAARMNLGAAASGANADITSITGLQSLQFVRTTYPSGAQPYGKIISTDQWGTLQVYQDHKNATGCCASDIWKTIVTAKTTSGLAIGSNSMGSSTGGYSNIAIGDSSATSHTNGIGNIAIGSYAAGGYSGGPTSALVNGNENVFVGFQSGSIYTGTANRANTSGSNGVTLIGANSYTDFPGFTGTNVALYSTAIGYYSSVSTKFTVALGRAADTTVIGSSGAQVDASGNSISTAKLQVTGGIQMVGQGGDLTGTVQNGTMAYNSTTQTFRAYQNGKWWNAVSLTPDEGGNFISTNSGNSQAITTSLSSYNGIANNVLIGGGAGQYIGSQNNSNSGNAQYANENIAIGPSAMRHPTGAVTSPRRAIALGINAMATAGQGIDNIAIGTGSLYRTSSVNSIENIAIGRDSGSYISNGENNIAIGTKAGNQTTTGSKNVTIGYQSGFQSVNAGSGNSSLGGITLIGADTLAPFPGGSVSGFVYATAIGAGASVATRDTIVLGRSNDITVIGDNKTNNTSAKLQVSGGLQLVPGPLPTGVNGMIVYDSSLSRFRGYSSGTWFDFNTTSPVNTAGSFSPDTGGNFISINSSNSYTKASSGSATDGIARNVLLGELAGQNLGGAGTSWSQDNIAIGKNAMLGSAGNSAASRNIAIGSGALFGISTGNDNVVLGFNALGATNSGSNNVAVGRNAGYANISGAAYANNSFMSGASGITLLGAGAGTMFTAAPSTTAYATAVGAEAIVNSVNTVVLGRTTDVTVVGAQGDNGLGARLQVSGAVQVMGTGSNPLGGAGMINYRTDTNRFMVYRNTPNTGLPAAAWQDISGVFGHDAGGNLVSSNSGNVQLRATTPGGNDGITRNILIGDSAGSNLTGTGTGWSNNNIALGSGAMTGSSGAIASRNVAIGQSSLKSISTGGGNVSIGYGSSLNATTASNNYVIGYFAFAGSYESGGGDGCCIVKGANGSGNFIVGYKAGQYFNGDNPSNPANNNVAIGNFAMRSASGSSTNGAGGANTGSNGGNFAFGGSAMSEATLGSFNWALGESAARKLGGGSQNIAIGYFAFAGTFDNSGGDGCCPSPGAYGSGNILVGHRSGQFLNQYHTSNPSNNNIAIGDYAMRYASGNGSYGNVAIGHLVMSDASFGSNNYSIGYGSQRRMTGGSGNYSLGHYAFAGQFEPNNNEAALGSPGSYGSLNYMIGHKAGQLLNGSNSSNPSSNNYAFGELAMRFANGGATGSNNYNYAIGRNALYSATLGSSNYAIGESVMYASTGGSSNYAFGANALYVNGGSNNLALGVNAGYKNTTGGSNVFLGYNAGYRSISNGTPYDANAIVVGAGGITLLGSGSGTNFPGTTALTGNLYATAIGADALVASVNTIVLGRTVDTTVIGAQARDTNRTERLQVTGGIYSSGDIYATGSITSASDARYKRNVVGITNALFSINQLQGVRYEYDTERWKDKNFAKGRQIGFIAQQIEPLVPELVVTDAQGYKSVNYAQMSALLAEGIKELDKNKLGNANDAWINSAEGKSRLFFEKNGKSRIKGYGDTAFEVLGDDDSVIAAFRRGGSLEVGKVSINGQRSALDFTGTGTSISSASPGEIIVNAPKAMRAAVRLQQGDSGQKAALMYGMLFGDEQGIGLADATGRPMLTAKADGKGAVISIGGKLVVGDGQTAELDLGSGNAIRTLAGGVLQLESEQGVRIFNPKTKEAVINLGSDGLIQAKRFAPTEVVAAFGSCAGKVGTIARDEAGRPMACLN